MRSFYDYLELGMANAFIIQEKLAAKKDEKLHLKTFLEFYRQVAQTLLTSCMTQSSSVVK